MAALAAIAASKAGQQLSIVSLLVVLMCELVLHLQSKRINRGITLQIRKSDHFGHADRAVADYNEQLLACVVFKTNKRTVIQAKDKPFWEYFYAKGNTFPFWATALALMQDDDEQPHSLKCKTYTEPQKPAATPKNLTTSALPEELIDRIASFDDSALPCNSCGVTHFQMEFFEKCSTPRNWKQFLKVNKEVEEEGGTCRISSWNDVRSGRATLQSAGHTLQSCMGRNSYLPWNSHWSQKVTRVLAACEVELDEEKDSVYVKHSKTNTGIGYAKAVSMSRQAAASADLPDDYWKTNSRRLAAASADLPTSVIPCSKAERRAGQEAQRAAIDTAKAAVRAVREAVIPRRDPRGGGGGGGGGGGASTSGMRSAEQRDDDDLELQEALALSLNAALPAGAVAAASQENALRNYELFHELKRGSATHAQVAASSSGIDGWAMSPQTAQHEAEADGWVMPHAGEEGAAQGEPNDPRPVRAGDDLEAKALQRALLASVGVKFDGMYKEQQSDDDEAD